jgi:hypothetical protein
MTESDKFKIKFSIFQTLTNKSTAEVASMIGYSRAHIYKVLSGDRVASVGLIDSLNSLVLFAFGSTMLELVNETINLIENTETGRLLIEGYSNAGSSN